MVSFFNKIAVFILFSSVLLSCGKNETDSFAALGKEYYPLQIGKAITYDVDSVIYDPQSSGSVKIDTNYWQIKEQVKDTFRDNSGILNYRIESYHRKKGESNWAINYVFSAALTNQFAIREENNLRFIKFPTVFNMKTSWDGNIYNDPSVKITIAGDNLELFAKKWTYQVESFGKSEKIGNKTYDDILTVVAQTKSTILTDKRYSLEKYAKGIGLVYKEEQILDTQKLDASIPWEKKAEKGYIVVQKAIEIQ